VTRQRAERPGFDSRHGQGRLVLFATASGLALGPTHPPIQWVPGALSAEVKRSGREAEHSRSSRAEVKNTRSCTFTPAIRLHGVVLVYVQVGRKCARL
jgi:hypothetical protein